MFCVTESLTVGFKNYLISAEKSENTVEKYIRDLRHFAAFLKGEVTREKVLAYKKELCEDYAPASVNSMLSSLNAFFDFAGRIDLKVKTLKISRRIVTDSERELKKSEYERLLLAAKEKKDERLCLLMQTMAGTGIRVSELRFITCEAAAKGKATVSLKGRVRTVFLPDALCRLIKAYAKKRGIKKAPFSLRETACRSSAETSGECSKICAWRQVWQRKRSSPTIFATFLQERFTRREKTS